MAFTLGFHIILASLGVALPAMMLIANYRGLRHDDADALKLAQRWSKAVAVTFAVGAVTGTVLSFEFGLLWPAFTGRFGQVFGVLFAIEGICFFLEAIFIAIYIFGMLRGRRDRIHRLGLLIPLPVACIATPIQFAVGDTAARAIAKHQPIKFAGMECVDQTSTDVTEYIYGRCTSRGVKGGIGIPGFDSFPARW